MIITQYVVTTLKYSPARRFLQRELQRGGNDQQATRSKRTELIRSLMQYTNLASLVLSWQAHINHKLTN